MYVESKLICRLTSDVVYYQLYVVLIATSMCDLSWVVLQGLGQVGTFCSASGYLP